MYFLIFPCRNFQLLIAFTVSCLMFSHSMSVELVKIERQPHYQYFMLNHVALAFDDSIMLYIHLDLLSYNATILLWDLGLLEKNQQFIPRFTVIYSSGTVRIIKLSRTITKILNPGLKNSLLEGKDIFRETKPFSVFSM